MFHFWIGRFLLSSFGHVKHELILDVLDALIQVVLLIFSLLHGVFVHLLLFIILILERPTLFSEDASVSIVLIELPATPEHVVFAPLPSILVQTRAVEEDEPQHSLVVVDVGALAGMGQVDGEYLITGQLLALN